MPTNIALLTKQTAVHAARHRARRDQPKEVVFDDSARAEFLTGFHKRKVQRTEEKKKKAIDRQKKGRLEERKENRRWLAERAAENAAAVEAAYRKQITGEDMDEDAGDEDTPVLDKGKQKEKAFEDEEQLATVTIVEDFDPSTLIHGPPRAGPSSPRSASPIDASSSTARTVHRPQKQPPLSSSRGATSSLRSRLTSTEEPKKAKAKSAKEGTKKFRYETKAARHHEKSKQRKRRLENAERSATNGKKPKAQKRQRQRQR